MPKLLRSYRIIIGAFAAVMLILLLKSSATSINSAMVLSPDTIPLSDPLIDSFSPEDGSKPIHVIGEDTISSSTPNAETAVPCTSPHQFIIMVDAGSTGSRVHVYEFDICTSPPALIKEHFEMIKPGLSSYSNDPPKSASSLVPLLEFAMENIPEPQWNCSPVSVKATAGLRMLGYEIADEILNQVSSLLQNKYPFPIAHTSGVSLMGGDEEGVYAWVTTNYLLGNIGGTGGKLPTSAVFDLGGGSTQIVFEPTYPPHEKMIPGEHKVDLRFDEKDYTLYQFSHLGYGLMEGRNKIYSVLVENAIKEGTIDAEDMSITYKLQSPCLPPNAVLPKQKVKLPSGNEYTVDFQGPEVPTGAQCRFLADKILNKDTNCEIPPCSFNGAHQPSLVRNFKESNDIYIFSYFYDRIRPLGMPLSFTLNELMDLARIVCNGKKTWRSVFTGLDDSLDLLEKDPNWCLDLSFHVSLLHTGYDIPLNRELKTARKIANNELGWCLGASLELLDSKDWNCKNRID